MGMADDRRAEFEKVVKTHCSRWDIWNAACEYQRKRDAEIAQRFGDQLALTNSLIWFGKQIGAAIIENSEVED